MTEAQLPQDVSAIALTAPGGASLPQNAWLQGTRQGSDWAEATEARVLEQALLLVGRRARWDADLAARATAAAGLSTADAELLMPQGARDLAVLLWRRHDALALEALGQVEASALKIRLRIRTAVLARLDAAMADRSATEAASVYLARPQRVRLALQLGWETADALWRWAGDTSTDENHYSKRALLCAILASTLAVRLARGEDAAARHLDARIANVMSFETWKARLPPLQDGLTVLAANLGRWRYRS